MADIEKNVVLTVDTGDAKQTVKGLKDEIATLKDTILNLDEGTEEYSDAVAKLQSDQRKLNEVMALTKKEAVALDGSYDALVHQMSLLKKEWRATNDEAKRQELGKQIAEINGQLKDFDASLGNFQRNVGNYQSALEGLENTTMTFSQKMSQMNESMEPTKQKFESVGKIASGVASGFAAVQGAAALLGIENDNLEKSLVKVQAAMAIAQGIGGLGGLVEGLGKAKVAFEGVNKSIKAVNATMGKAGWIAVIMAVITAITLIVGHLKKKKQTVDTLGDSIDELNRKNENLKASETERARQLEREIKLMQAQGATDEEVLKKRLEHNNAYLDASKKAMKEAEKIYRGLENSQKMGIRGADGKKIKDEQVQQAKETYEALNETYKNYVEKQKDLENDLVIYHLKNRKILQTPELPVLDDVVIEEPEIEVTEKVSTKYEYSDGDAEKSSNILIGIYERQFNRKKELNAMSEQSEEERLQKEYELNLEYEEKKLQILEEAYDKANKNGDGAGLIELAEQIADQELAIERTKYEEKERLREQDEENEKNHQENISNIMNASMDATKALIDGIAAMYEADGEVNEQEAKKLKNLRIASATIEMLQGAITAYSSAQQLGPIAGPIVGGVNAAAVVAMGLANIQKIKNTDFTGTVSQVPMTPNVQTYQPTVPEGYTRIVTGANNTDALNNGGDIRVVLVESDVENAMNRIKVRTEESTF